MMAILHAHLGARLVFHKVFARSRPKTLNWKAKKICNPFQNR
jgi:hypothetical protein